MYAFNKGECVYWNNLTKCNFLQRVIIINSILYYELNTTKMSDKQFDEVCKQLLELEYQTPNYNKTQYYYVFKDFDGTTGFYIWDRLNKNDKKYLLKLCNYIVGGKNGNK